MGSSPTGGTVKFVPYNLLHPIEYLRATIYIRQLRKPVRSNMHGDPRTIIQEIFERRREEQHRYTGLKPNTLPVTDHDPEPADDHGVVAESG